MKSTRSALAFIVAVLVSTLLLAGPALASPGNGNGYKDDQLGAQTQETNVNEQDQSTEDSGTADDSEPGDKSKPGKSGEAQGQTKKEDTDSESADASGQAASQSTSKTEDQPAKGSSKAAGQPEGSKDSRSSGSKNGGSANTAPAEDSKQDGPVHGCDQAKAGHTHDYASTCDGSPSKNGNGGGDGGGKPCAGCVGAADNKNPPGQFPNGTDHNNGYECDGNSGVGKTNPAHTGCPPPPTVPVCDADINTPGIQPCVPPPPPPVCDGDINTPGIQPCLPPPPVCDADINMPGIQPCKPPVDGDSVKGVLIGPSVDGDSVLPQVVTPDHVLEVQLRPKAPLGSVLPVTGVDVIPAALISSLGLISSGLVALRRRRF